MKDFPPMRVALAGAVFIAFGVFGLLELVVVAIGEETGPSLLNFFGIFIGYGLLIGRSSSRFWALFWALFIALVGVSSLFNYLRSEHLDRLMTSLKMIVPSIFVIWALCPFSGRDWFKEQKEGSAGTRVFAWGIALVTGWIFTIDMVEDREINQMLSRLHGLDVTIILVDEADGNPLKSVGYTTLDPHSYSSSREEKRLKPKISFSSWEGATAIFCEGVIDPPYEINLTSDGYEPQVLSLNEKDSGVIRVLMKKAQ